MMSYKYNTNTINITELVIQELLRCYDISNDTANIITLAKDAEFALKDALSILILGHQFNIMFI